MSKIGRNPFDKKPSGTKASKKAAPKKAKKPFPGSKHDRKKIEASELSKLWHEINYRWVPRAKACTYLRLLKMLSKLS